MINHSLEYSRVEVDAKSVAGSEVTASILPKQKVEIATLPSVARNDIALFDASVYYPVVNDDKFLKKNYEYKNHK